MFQTERTRTRASRLLVIAALAASLCLFLSGCVTMADGTRVNIFILLIVRPFGWILRKIYDVIGSYGWSIIIFQLLAKLLLLPLSIKGKKGMMDMQRIQPKLQELEKRYKNDQQKYQQEMAKLYKAEGVSPMSGCLPTLLTFPFMIGLYWPISQPLTYLMNLTADEIAKIRDILGLADGLRGSELTVAQAMYENFELIKDVSPNIIRMDFTFLGCNLGAVPDWKQPLTLLFLIPIISGVTSYLLTQLTNHLQYKSTGSMPQGQNSTMMYMMPLVSVWFGFTLPAGLGVYWIASNITQALQEVFLHFYFEKKKQNEPLPESGNSSTLLKEENNSNGQKSRSHRKNH